MTRALLVVAVCVAPLAGACDSEPELSQVPPSGGDGGEGGAGAGGAGPNTKAIGEECAAASECVSGFCADGVCCAGGCTQPCFSCALPETRGQCAPLPTAEPADACDGVCDGSGTCATGTILWTNTLGGPADEIAVAAAADSFGNIVVVGYVLGSANLGGGPLPAHGNNDIFVAKLDPEGNHLWSHQFGGPEGDYPSSVAVDDANNVIVTGSFQGAADFGGPSLSSAGGGDVFVAKLSSSAGNVMWLRRFGGPGHEQGFGVAHRNETTFVGVGASGPIDVGGGPTGASTRNVGVLTLNTFGDAATWQVAFAMAGDFEYPYPRGIAVDEGGNKFLVGEFDGTVMVGGNAHASSGVDDAFLIEVEPSGTIAQFRSFGGSGSERLQTVAAGASGDIVVGGRFTETIDLGEGTITSVGGVDAIVARYEPELKHAWSARYGKSFGEARSVAVDGHDNAVVAALFTGGVEIGGAVEEGEGAFLLKLGTMGEALWSRLIVDTGAQGYVSTGGIAVDPTQNIVLVGTFNGTVEIGARSFTADPNGPDLFVVKLTP